MNEPDNTTADRDVVTRFLRGEFDPTERPEWFEEDILLFAVARLELRDTEWLLAQLANRTFAYDLRAWIVPMMRKYGARGQAALNA